METQKARCLGVLVATAVLGAPAGAQADPAADSPTPGSSARDWPGWRGPAGTGYAAEADPPLTWSETSNVRWKTPLPGYGHSTPVIWGGELFVTAARPVGEALEPRPDTAPGAHDNAPVTHEQELLVLGLSTRDGRILWERNLDRILPHEGGHVSASFASPSPSTDGEVVVAPFGSHGLFVLDRNGEELWRKDLGRMQTKHGHGEGASPVLYGDSVVVNWDHEGPSFVVALDKRTGEERWRAEREEVTSWSSPIVVEVDGRAQVVVNGTGRIRAYDLATGDVLWECGGLSHNVVASPVFHDGQLFAGSSYEKQALLGLNLSGAQGDLTETDHLMWFRRRSGPYVPSLLLADGGLFFLRHYQGVLYRVDPETGRDTTSPLRLDSIGNVYASPIAAQGRLYITDQTGTTLVLSTEAKPRTLAVNRLNDRINASGALAGDALYLRGENFLYCLANTEEGSDERSERAK